MRYPVLYQGRAFGYGEGSREGLYIRWRFYCTLPDEKIYRIIMNGPQGMQNMGICVPTQNGPVLEKTLAIQNCDKETEGFTLCPAAAQGNERFYPVREDAPFLQLSKVMQGRFAIEEGEKGLWLRAEPGV